MHKVRTEFYSVLDKDVDWLELMSLIDTFRDKYPEDVRLVPVDDSLHSSSLLVLIESKDKESWFGVDAFILSQSCGMGRFFLYPSNLADFQGALASVNANMVGLLDKD